MRVCPNRPVVSNTVGWVFSAALAWLLIITAWKILQWLRTPSPLPIPLSPAPATRFGVAGRIFLELFAFRALARANKWTWIASIVFHYALLLIMLMHLRFVLPHLPLVLLPFIRFSTVATVALLVALFVLLVRRCVIDRLRYISSPSDYLHLLLIMALALSGTALRNWWPTDLYAIGQFVRGALSLSWQPLPAQLGVWIHVSLALVLMLVFPISKLLHGVAIPFTPTLNQRDPGA